MLNAQIDSKAGLSLVEVMVAIALLLIVSGPLAKSLMLSREQAEKNVYAISVNTVVQGYLEQLKSMDLEKLTEAEIKTIRLSTTGSGAARVDDPLKPGVYNAILPVDINNTPNESSDDIRIEIQPLLADLRSDAEVPRIDIVLNYRWEQPNYRTEDRDKWVAGSYRYVRSRIKSF